MKSFVRREVLCPYYHREELRHLYCEGPTRGINLQLNFMGAKGFDAYVHRYCCRDWMLCRVAQMLERKYDEKGREKTQDEKL